jgi:hypothetical protein
MSNRIVLPNGAPAPEPQVCMKDLIEKARKDWSVGKKADAFEAAVTGLELCSRGIARLMRDMETVMKAVDQLSKEKGD